MPVLLVLGFSGGGFVSQIGVALMIWVLIFRVLIFILREVIVDHIYITFDGNREPIGFDVEKVRIYIEYFLPIGTMIYLSS